MLTPTVPGMYTLNRNQLQSSMKIESYKKLSKMAAFSDQEEVERCNNHWQEEISHVCSWYWARRSSGGGNATIRGWDFFWDLEYFSSDKMTWYGLDIPNPKSLILGLGAAAAAGVAQSGECTQINRVPQAASFSDLDRPSSSFEKSCPPHCIFHCWFPLKSIFIFVNKWTLEIFGQIVIKTFSVS